MRFNIQDSILPLHSPDRQHLHLHHSNRWIDRLRSYFLLPTFLHNPCICNLHRWIHVHYLRLHRHQWGLEQQEDAHRLLHHFQHRGRDD